MKRNRLLTKYLALIASATLAVGCVGCGSTTESTEASTGMTSSTEKFRTINCFVKFSVMNRLMHL